LKNLAWVRLALEMTHIEDLIGKGKTQKSMAEVSISQAAPYAAADAVAVHRLHPVLQKELEEKKSDGLLHALEMPLVGILMQMESTGILVDVPFFKSFSKELNGKMVNLEDQIQKTAGVPFNLNSTQQLSKILFDTLHLEPPGSSRKTTSGHLSTSADILDEMRGQHQVVDWILEYRELSKLKSTYVDALPEQVNPKTGRIHTSYNQTGTVTGRIGSSDPNLQNIPTRTEQGKRVREGFIAGKGNVLLSIDYSQIELRIVAHMAEDDAMIDAFNAGQDIHATTAAAIYNVPLDEVTRDMRRHAKAINFGLIYGMSAFGLSRSTGLTPAEAENFVKEYFMQFPHVKSFLDQLRKDAAKVGYVQTLFGRRRYFPGLATQTNFNIRSREEREAINAPIQGTAADIIKRAMLKIPEALKSANLNGKLLLQVHDELVLECPEVEIQKTARVAKQEMESTCVLKVPLSTDAKKRKNWGVMTPLEKA
jgi:DNA polymerase-1